jgi:hypothetical protein
MFYIINLPSIPLFLIKTQIAKGVGLQDEKMVIATFKMFHEEHKRYLELDCDHHAVIASESEATQGFNSTLAIQAARES